MATEEDADCCLQQCWDEHGLNETALAAALGDGGDGGSGAVDDAAARWCDAADLDECLRACYEAESSTQIHWWQLLLAALLVLLSGLFSGLTLGLMGLDKTLLEVIAESGEEREREYARRIAPVREHSNLLLCTLLLGNTVVNSLLSILLSSITSGLIGLLLSTALIVVFGEIFPQALCSRHGLMIGAKTIWLVKLFGLVLFPVAYPVSKVLDLLLGRELGTAYSKEELHKLIEMHVTHPEMKAESGLTLDDHNMLSGVLDFKEKRARDVMTALDKVFMLDKSTKLNFHNLAEIYKSGFTRIPIYSGTRENIVGVLYAKDLILVDPEDEIEISALLTFHGGHTLRMVEATTTLDRILRDIKKNYIHLLFVTGHDDPAARGGKPDLPQLQVRVDGSGIEEEDEEEEDVEDEEARRAAPEGRKAGSLRRSSHKQAYRALSTEEARPTKGSKVIRSIELSPRVEVDNEGLSSDANGNNAYHDTDHANDGCSSSAPAAAQASAATTTMAAAAAMLLPKTSSSEDVAALQHKRRPMGGAALLAAEPPNSNNPSNRNSDSEMYVDDSDIGAVLADPRPRRVEDSDVELVAQRGRERAPDHGPDLERGREQTARGITDGGGGGGNPGKQPLGARMPRVGSEDHGSTGMASLHIRVVGIITLEDVIEELIQDEIVDETDNVVDVNKPHRDKVRGTHKPNVTTFLKMIEEREGAKELSRQELKAVCAFLAVSVKEFRKLAKANDNVFKGLIRNAELIEVDEEQAASHPPIYTRGVTSDTFTLIIQGRVKVRAGREGFESELGPWNVLGHQALQAYSNEQDLKEGSGVSLYKPDFTATVEGACRLISLSRASYLAARRLAQLEFVAGGRTFRHHVKEERRTNHRPPSTAATTADAGGAQSSDAGPTAMSAGEESPWRPTAGRLQLPPHIRRHQQDNAYQYSDFSEMEEE